jgi:hypothetical protein
MRKVVDLLIVAMVLAMLAGLVWSHRSGERDDVELDRVRESVRRLKAVVWDNRQVDPEAQIGTVFPATIDPAWFRGGVPENTLLDGRRPWVDMAGPSHADLEHPPDRAAGGGTSARFWYNPGTGDVRARVPADLTEDEALRTYNYINECALESLF